jgi:putative membrane protein
MRILFRILFTALGVMAAAAIVPGIGIASFWTAVVVAIVLGILNVTVGFVLKILTFPLSVVTFGLFLLVINALMFWAASFVKGFHVAGFWAAFFGSLIVTIISMVGRRIVRGSSQNYHSQF